jgi:hypothetical protein
MSPILSNEQPRNEHEQGEEQSMKPEAKSISDLIAGDSVIVRSRNGSSLGVLSKVTKTQLTVGLNKFNRSSGRQIGSTAFYGMWITVPVDGEIERVRAETRLRLLSNKLGGIDWRKQPLETLEKINAILTTQPQSNE